jgi:hypothetical protein
VLLGIWIRKSRAFFANVRPDKVAEQTQPFQGYWQAIDYGYWDDSAGTPVHLPLSEMKLKSQIARPRVYGRLEPRRPYTYRRRLGGGHGRHRDLDPASGGASWVQGDFLDR